MVVAVGGQNLNHAVSKVEERHVKGAAAQVKDEDLLVDALLVKAIGKSSSRGLVDDTAHVEASDLAGVLGGLTLGVVEVGRDGDDRVGDGLAQVLLGVSLHLGQDHGADLLGGEVLAVNLDDGTVAHAALHAIRHGLQLGADLVVTTAHEALDGEAVSVGTEADDGRGGAVALSVDDNRGLAALEDCHRGVGGAQVDADNLAHGLDPFLYSAASRRVVVRISMFPCSSILYII